MVIEFHIGPIQQLIKHTLIRQNTLVEGVAIEGTHPEYNRPCLVCSGICYIRGINGKQYAQPWLLLCPAAFRSWGCMPLCFWSEPDWQKTAYQGAWLLAGNGIILNYHLSLQLDKRWFSRIESIRLSSGRTSIVAWRGWARFLVWPPLSIEVRNKNGHKEHDSSGMTQGHQNGAIASIRALPSRMASSPWVRRTCGFSARAAIMKSALSNPRREAS